MNDVLKLYRDVLRTDYCAYVKHCNNGYKVSKFHRFLCDTVQDFVETETGHAYDILIVSVPPQHGKSLTITETLPSWLLGRDPEARIIEISYSEDFAQTFGRRNLQKIKEYGGEIFGIKIGNPANATEFELEGHRGGMISRGLLSGVTGKQCHYMIIDDPVKNRQEADSEAYRNRVYDEWLSSFKSRFAAGAKVILIMTRWHEDDLAGRLIETEDNVKVVNIPLEAEENDILGRKIGDALCPEIGKDNAWLSDFKKSYTSVNGTMAWNALFQGRPTGLEGNLIKREWWQYYDTLPHIEKWAMSVDAAFKDGDDNDFVAIQVWGKTNADMYMIDAVKKHLDMPSTMREIRRLRGMYPQCKTTYIEDKANGSAIIKMLRSEMTGIIAVNPDGGKVSRVNAVIGAIESGNCYLPKNKPFVGDFVDECAAFPNGKHDDQCFVAGTKVATPYGDRNIEEIKVGDKVLTPFGIRKVIAAGCTGEKETVIFHGVEGTPGHKFYYNGEFREMDSLTQIANCSIISLKEVLQWKYRKLLYLTGSSIDSWEGRKDIIYLSQLPMKADGMLKDCMLRFGNFIADKKYLTAMKFITKTVILSITTTVTLSVYHASNTLKSIVRKLSSTERAKSSLNISKVFGAKPQNGTVAMRENNGIKNIGKILSEKLSQQSVHANIAGKSTCQNAKIQDFVLIRAMQTGDTITREKQNSEHALFAGKNSQHTSEEQTRAQALAVKAVKVSSCGKERKKVYNITVEKDHLYYASGFLVSNCDAMSQILNKFIYADAKEKKVKRESDLEKAFPGLKKRKGRKFDKGDKIHVV